jgi:hypothetical protein
MQHKRRIAIGLAIVAAAVMLPVTALGGQPIIRDHESVISPPEPGDWCGAVDGIWSGRAMFTFTQDASGGFHATQVERSSFTANATGRTIELDAAGVDMGTATDNGDGTVTFTEHTAGLALTIRIPNGPILKDASGKPLIGAGVIDSVVTIDEETGDIVSYNETFHGPHPLRDGVDICTPATNYLTSP